MAARSLYYLLLFLLLISVEILISNATEYPPIQDFEVYEYGPTWMAMYWSPPDPNKGIEDYIVKYRQQLLTITGTDYREAKPTKCSCWKDKVCLVLKDLMEEEKTIQIEILVNYTDNISNTTLSLPLNNTGKVPSPRNFRLRVSSSGHLNFSLEFPSVSYKKLTYAALNITSEESYLREQFTRVVQIVKLKVTLHGCDFKYQREELDLLPSTVYKAQIHFITEEGKSSETVEASLLTSPVEPYFNETLALVPNSIGDGMAKITLPPAIANLTRTSAYFVVVSQVGGPPQNLTPAPVFRNEVLLQKILQTHLPNTWVAAEIQLHPEETVLFTLGMDNVTSGDFGSNYTNQHLVTGCEYMVYLTAVNQQEDVILTATTNLTESFIMIEHNEAVIVLFSFWFYLLGLIPLIIIVVLCFVFRRHLCCHRQKNEHRETDLMNLVFSNTANLYSANDVPRARKTIMDEVIQEVKISSFKVGYTQQRLKKDGQGHKILLADLQDYVLKALASGELKQEHEQCSRGNTQGCNYGQLPANKQKNRYVNLAAYDETRVVLKRLEDDSLFSYETMRNIPDSSMDYVNTTLRKPSCGSYVNMNNTQGKLSEDYMNTPVNMNKPSNDDQFSDYINANYIDGYKHPQMYIATQGPISKTIPDFWHMVWQEKVQIICMLTNLIEDDKVKCEQYWPEHGSEATYGQVTVRAIESRAFADFTFRHFKVFCMGQHRDIQQLHFTSWPNHGVPHYARSVALYLQHLLTTPQGDGPIVVHCSAGVGRTGTIILTDINLRMAAAEGAVDVLRHLRQIRKQRPDLVVNAEQYKLVHTVLLECLLKEPTAVTCGPDFSSRIATLKTAGEIDCQYQQLEYRCHQDQELVEYFEAESCVSYDLELNISHVSGYQYRDQFITCQLPTRTMTTDFWGIIVRLNISIVLVLNSFDCIQDEYGLWPSQLQPISPDCDIRVSFIRATDNGTHVHSELLLTAGNSNRRLEVLRLNNWPKGWETPAPSEVLSMWDNVKRLYKGKGQILVTCRDGVTASGLFVALAYLTDKMTLEQVCDVCETVRTIRQSNSKFITSKCQFTFLYQAAMEFMESWETYANFQ